MRALLPWMSLCLALSCAHRPAWLADASGARDESFIGVGHVTGIRNPRLGMASAESRARAEAARVLDDYLGRVSRACLDGASWLQRHAASQAEALRWLSDTALSSVAIRDRWTSGDESAALAEVTLPQLFDAWGVPADAPFRACAAVH